LRMNAIRRRQVLACKRPAICENQALTRWIELSWDLPF
jgi:hypothetical protein